MGAAISYFSPTIVAGVDRAAVINVTGALFVCKEASTVFYMQFDDGPKFQCEGGFSIRPPGGFRRITLFNQSATDDLTVTLYAGDAYVSYDYVRIPKTRLKATSVTLAAGATIDLPGIDAGNRRKEILITDTDTTDAIDVIDKDSSTQMLRIFAQRTQSIETDADVRIKNPAGTGSTFVMVAETFYL